MQRASTPIPASPSTVSPGHEIACPVCGAPVRGIATSRPGEHRFVGCDHYASGRILRQYDGGNPDGPRLRLGP